MGSVTLYPTNWGYSGCRNVMVPAAENLELFVLILYKRIHCLRPGARQDIASRASLTARNSAILISDFQVHSTSFLFSPLPT